MSKQKSFRSLAFTAARDYDVYGISNDSVERCKNTLSLQESTEYRVQSTDDIVSTKERAPSFRLYKSVLCTLYSVLSVVTSRLTHELRNY